VQGCQLLGMELSDNIFKNPVERKQTYIFNFLLVNLVRTKDFWNLFKRRRITFFDLHIQNVKFEDQIYVPVSPTAVFRVCRRSSSSSHL